MPRQGSADRWPVHNPGLMDELIRRCKFEIEQRANGYHMFQIGDLHFWFSKRSFHVDRFVGPESYMKSRIIAGEMKTNAWNEWGSEEDARFAVDVLQQRQILEDIAHV